MKRRASRWIDYTQPVAYGVRLWLACLFGYRPTDDDEPEVVA